MFDLHDVVLSTRDAAALSALVADWPARDASEQAAADLLADALAGAHVVSDRTVATDVVALGAGVLATTLRRNVVDRSFQHFQKCLLNTFSRDVSSNADVLAGLSDLVNSVFHPLRFKASLIFGALMYMFLSLGGSVASLGGIFMFTAGIVCVMLANTLTFGVLANTVENFTQGKLQSNFMPTFDEFSLWDDVVHPFFLMIGVYVSSFGPALMIVIVTFFFMSNVVQKEAANFENISGRAVVPDLPYAENAAKQS